MSDATFPKTRKSNKVVRAQAAPVDDYQDEDDNYDDYDDYEEGVVADNDEQYWDEEDSEETLVAAPGRAIALGVAGLALLVVFSAVIWLLSTRGPQVPTLVDGPAGGVPVMQLLQQSPDMKPSQGSVAPDFQWTEPTNNQTVQLSSFRGTKPVFVNFWGTWCPPCRAEMPAMESFYQKHKDEIQMIGVSMYPRDDPGIVLSFVKDAKYSWKFIHDSDYKVAEKYQVASVPSSYFIDRTGVIKAVQVGAMTEQMMENYFQQVR